MQVPAIHLASAAEAASSSTPLAHRARTKTGVVVRRFGRLIAVTGFVLCAHLIGAAGAFADTHISSSITSNTTWGTSGSPYYLDSSINVASGVTLTIQSGVVVKFNGGIFTTLYVHGTLDASGSSSSHVTFTSSQDGSTGGSPGQWYMIQVDGNVNFSWVDVRYGGWGYADATSGELSLNGAGSASLDHVSMTSSMTSGLVVGAGESSTPWSSATVTHSTFSNNDDGIYVLNGYLSLTDNNQLTSNTNDGLALSYTEGYGSTASSITRNTISGNGRYGVNYSSTGAFRGASNVPTGHYNNIYDNSSRQFNRAQYDPTLDWTDNYWGAAYTYSNPEECSADFPNSSAHIQFNNPFLTGRGDGPVSWDPNDVTIVYDGVAITYHCGIDYLDAIPYQNDFIDNSGY